MIYLNNAATSFPKPEAVVSAVSNSLLFPPFEPGRSNGRHSLLDDLRQRLGYFFKVQAYDNITILPSATYALNVAIFGLVEPGSHVVTTKYEHNSVLRPLQHLIKEKGVTLSFLSPHECQEETIAVALDTHAQKNTSLVIMSHMSNVTGTRLPIETAAKVLSNKEIPFLIDGAQGAGCVALDYDALPGKNYYAFAGHKALLGPPGTGGLIVADNTLPQAVFGGTGVLSSQLEQPTSLPLRHEAGTYNMPGIHGLFAGLNFVIEHGLRKLSTKRKELVELLLLGLNETSEFQAVPNLSGDYSAGICSLNMPLANPQEVALILSQSFNIETRAGLHCSPLVASAFDLSPHGTLRLSVGPYTTREEVEKTVESLKMIMNVL